MESYFTHSWLPYFYLYGLGGLLFSFGVFITLKSESFKLKNEIHFQWLYRLIFGFFWYMVIHASLTLFALNQNQLAIYLIMLFIVLSIALYYLMFKRK